jgi:hypothetical protein
VPSSELALDITQQLIHDGRLAACERLEARLGLD